MTVIRLGLEYRQGKGLEGVGWGRITRTSKRYLVSSLDAYHSSFQVGRHVFLDRASLCWYMTVPCIFPS